MNESTPVVVRKMVIVVKHLQNKVMKTGGFNEVAIAKQLRKMNNRISFGLQRSIGYKSMFSFYFSCFDICPMSKARSQLGQEPAKIYSGGPCSVT